MPDLEPTIGDGGPVARVTEEPVGWAQVAEHAAWLEANGWDWELKFATFLGAGRHRTWLSKDGVHVSGKGDTASAAMHDAIIKLRERFKPEAL